MHKYPALIICGFCKKPWEECKCREVQEKEGLKANGYALDKSDEDAYDY